MIYLAEIIFSNEILLPNKQLLYYVEDYNKIKLLL